MMMMMMMKKKKKKKEKLDSPLVYFQKMRTCPAVQRR